ncbi:Biotin--protein ligase [Podosphaera aphanis]|nr:Biotin--protein ligase [Podosphaera aphanis]
MSKQKMNVLVYSGVGSTANSVRHCILSLRRLISLNYAVIPVTDRVILNEPWTTSCALLVFPGGADTGYCHALDGQGNRIIDQYIRRGGSYLGFCAGGYYGSSRCEFEVGNKDLEVVGRRELSFFPGTCRGSAFSGFRYRSEVGARAVQVAIVSETLNAAITGQKFRCYYNGGGVFVDSKNYENRGVEVLASYTDSLDVDGGDGSAAAVFIKFGGGRVILTGPHPEFAAANMNREGNETEYVKIIEALEKDDALRNEFLKACLGKLGLTTDEEESIVPPLSQLHLSSMYSDYISQLLLSWENVNIISKLGQEEYINGENDIFCLLKNDPKTDNSLKSKIQFSTEEIEQKQKSSDQTSVSDNGAKQKQLIIHRNEWPEAKETPYFDHEKFYTDLKTYQEEKGSKAENFGKYLLYGEVVTSTNTMLEKNTQLLSGLPTGFTFTATTQLAGRGRGSNVWISPAGSLITSLIIKHDMPLNDQAPIVFVQYLAAMATVEGIHTYDNGYHNIPVKLKWPNDIYARDPSQDSGQEYVKIGGILVNSSYSTGVYNLVVGIGLNATNTAPTISLNALLPPNAAPFTREKLLARILTKFECLYQRFCHSGFDSSLEALYYSYWLHSNQIVTLESQGCARVRIKGITLNWGFLKAEELDSRDRPTGKMWELQSDSNSFDFFRGLLKAKN